MIRNIKSYIFLLIYACFSLTVKAQLSPGELTQAHAELEGMSNCTLCHDLGSKVSNQKCLDCHKEIQSLITADRGYHANGLVENRDCFECHSEHHGRRFDMVRFDEDKFNHNLTGYELQGKHEAVECRDCHMRENIADREIRGRQDTFLGLTNECLSCHDDYHQETLPTDCAQCHNMDGFSPAANFNHDDTDYPLLGEHIQVECTECHQQTTRNGQEFQEFAGIVFEDCKSCHDDPHNSRIEGTCTQCHKETSFDDFIGNGNFNHNRTGFRLNGKHNTTDCFECHAQQRSAATVFNDRSGIDENNCASCHDDQHEGKFGNDCAKCHIERSFLSLNSMEFFDHAVTDYPLEGQHIGVDCKECHVGRFSEPIDFTACKNCHDDYHREEFAVNGNSPDCMECHSLEHGFEFSLYTLEQHQESAFPLDGAHTATPCFACHVSEEDDRWSFRNIGSECVDCHTDIHEGKIDTKFYPESTCTSCHESEAWASVTFDHNRTDWPLEGSHTQVNCKECHFEMADDDTIANQVFNNLDTQCASCHENVHGNEFEINGVTDCARCHIPETWFPDKFDHSTTRFPLEGRHAEVDCKACHEKTDEKGEVFVIYKIEKFECIDCHQ